VTSIANVNRGAVSATSSINRPAQDSSGQKSDDLRYAYVQRMIKARKEKEKNSKQPTTKETVQKKFAIKLGAQQLGTGTLFRRSGPRGLDRTLLKMKRKFRSTFSSFQPKDLKFLGDIIERHARNLPTGVGFSRLAKKEMKRIVYEAARKKYEISQVDAERMRSIIDTL